MTPSSRSTAPALLLLALLSCARPASAPARPPAPPDPHASVAPRVVPGSPASARSDRPVVIRAGRLLDGLDATPQTDVLIVIEGQHITAVGRDVAVPAGALEIDLHDATVLPGLIDGHTHLLASGADDYTGELVNKSIPYRALEASAAARTALSNGFTALRDVESEGAMYADVDLKRAINQGLIPGPRLWVSTRGISTTGRYLPFGTSWELELPSGAQLVVGETEARAAVREQIGHGADWIKIYVDFSPYWVDDQGTIHGVLNFTDLELGAMIEEAHRLRRRVAVHAMSRDGIAQALLAGADSIEHGHGIDDALARQAIKQGVFVCPTTLAENLFYADSPPAYQAVWETGWRGLARAHQLGVKMAFCTDAGSFPWSINQATGLALYVEKLGFTPAEVLRAATLTGAELLGQEGALGQITPGALADVIAVHGDPSTDLHALETVVFVMIDGQVFRDDR